MGMHIAQGEMQNGLDSVACRNDFSWEDTHGNLKSWCSLFFRLFVHKCILWCNTGS